MSRLESIFWQVSMYEYGKSNQNSMIECSNQGSTESWYLLVEICLMAKFSFMILVRDDSRCTHNSEILYPFSRDNHTSM